MSIIGAIIAIVIIVCAIACKIAFIGGLFWIAHVIIEHHERHKKPEPPEDDY